MNQRVGGSSDLADPVTYEAAAAVAGTWGGCFRSVRGRAGSLVAAQRQVWACGFQPKGGSSFLASEHHLFPSKTFKPIPWVIPLLLEALRKVSVFLIGYSLMQMAINEVINAKMLCFLLR